MDTLFMNSEISNKSDPRRLSLNLTDKIDLRWKDKYIALSNLSIHYTWENIKKAYIRIINLKYQLWHGMKNLNYLTRYSWFFEYILKTHRENTVNPSIKKIHK